MSWGISVRFQTLSPIQRQVAHALLTRPPLNYLCASRRINKSNSVRLECVMHAASVHPEPGSNSRKNYFTSSPLGLVITFRVTLILNSFTLLSIYNSLDEISSFAHTMLCTSLLLFNFQWPFSLSRGQPDHYITLFFSCQYLFQNFLKFFKAFFRGGYQVLFFDSLHILPLWKRFVNRFFWEFFGEISKFHSPG